MLCAVDVNGDQLDDVLVGAPLYSTNITEEGRVYVYLNKGSVCAFSFHLNYEVSFLTENPWQIKLPYSTC